MTIKSFIFDAARVRGTRGRTVENLRGPIANADPRSVCILEAPGAMPRYAHLVSATLGSIWPIQIRRYSSPRSFRRFFLPLGSSPIPDRHCRQLRVFFCGTPLWVLRVRRMSLPRNYFRMIPIAGQIKTALSAPRADRGRSFANCLREDASAI